MIICVFVVTVRLLRCHLVCLSAAAERPETDIDSKNIIIYIGPGFHRSPKPETHHSYE